MLRITILLFILMPAQVFAGNYKGTPDPSMTINSMAYPDRIVGQLFVMEQGVEKFYGSTPLFGPAIAAGTADLMTERINDVRKIINKPMFIRFRFPQGQIVDYPVTIKHNSITANDLEGDLIPIKKDIIVFVLEIEGRPIPGEILGHGEIASYARTDAVGPACEWEECYIAKVFTEKASLGTMGNKYPLLKQEAKKILNQCKKGAQHFKQFLYKDDNKYSDNTPNWFSPGAFDYFLCMSGYDPGLGYTEYEGQQYLSNGQFSGKEKGYIIHDAPTSSRGGQSGSPLFSVNADGGMRIEAFHAATVCPLVGYISCKANGYNKSLELDDMHHNLAAPAIYLKDSDNWSEYVPGKN